MSSKDHEDDPESYWEDKAYWEQKHGEDMLKREEREYPNDVPFSNHNHDE